MLTLWPGRRSVTCRSDTPLTSSGLGQGPPGGQQFLLLWFPKPCATILIQHAPGWPVPDRLLALSERHLLDHLDLALSPRLELLSVFAVTLRPTAVVQLSSHFFLAKMALYWPSNKRSKMHFIRTHTCASQKSGEEW